MKERGGEKKMSKGKEGGKEGGRKEIEGGIEGGREGGRERGRKEMEGGRSKEGGSNTSACVGGRCIS